ncbi:unnamed protein product, partial [Meganyctiphanes norvegica]
MSPACENNLVYIHQGKSPMTSLFEKEKVNRIENVTITAMHNANSLKRKHCNFNKPPNLASMLVLVVVLTVMVGSVRSAPTSSYSTGGARELVLSEGRYHGLRIDISDSIAQEDCRVVLNGLKSVLEAWSSALHVATDGRASLGSATVVMPSKWSSRPCLLPITPDHISKIPIQNAQIRVEPPHAVFGDLPYVQQSGGCGKGGDYLQMGAGFLSLGNSTSEQLGLAGRLLVAEWAKYRWGVFSEASQGHDATYPPYWYTHDGEWLPSVCSNGVERPLPPFCPPEADHLCTWQPQPHHNATSSLLAMPNLQQVAKLCSRKDHNREVPTKQNHLCKGRSAWEVMELSQDFVDGRNPSSPVLPAPPQLYFVSRPRLRFILLVEDSDIMNVQRRWEFVRKAVRRVMVYDLPDGAEAGVVVFNKRSREAAPLARLESVTDLRERVGSSLPRNPATAGARDTCVMCGLRQSLDTLREGEAETHGSNIIMITSGSHSRKNEAKEVEQMVKSEGLRLVLLLYPVVDRPGHPTPTHALADIAKKSGGSIITVMDEGVGNDSKVSMLVSLMEALRAAVMVGGAITPALVHSHSYPGGRASLAEGTFVLDDTLGRAVRFAVYYYSLAHVGNTIKLTGPSGSTFASVSLQEEDQDVNMIFVSLREAERGVWRYHVENRADSHQALHVQVTADNRLDNPVTVRVWTSQDRENHQPDAVETHTRDKLRATAESVIIYGEIKINDIPVMGAAVMAILQRLGTNSTGGTYPAVNVPLLDLGTGEPDITRGDGVYSRFAPALAGPARYSIVLMVDAGQGVIPLPRPQRHDYRHQHKIIDMQMPILGEGGALGGGCCGSSLPYTDTRQAPPFTRHLAGPTIEITTNTATSDTIMAPPARITDLIAWVNSTSGKIVLEWTAVGSSWDWGTALQYEGFVADRIAEARRCRGTPLRSLPSNPAPASQRERITLEIYISENLGKWICVRAVNQHGMKGSPSNPAGAWPPRPHGHDHATIGARGEGLTTREDMQKHTEKIAVISGCLIGVALIAILVFGYCYFFPVALIKKFNKRTSSLDDLSQNKGSVLINGRSPSRMSDSRGSVHGSPDVAKIEVIPLTACTTQNEAMYDQRTKESGNNTNLTGLNHNKNNDNSMKSTLSMSIPDVTKVQVPVMSNEEPITPEMNQKFYTLGHNSSTNHRSPLRLRGTDDVGCASNETPTHKYTLAEAQNIDDSQNSYYSPPTFDDASNKQTASLSHENLLMSQGVEGQYRSPYPTNPFNKNYDPSYHPHHLDAHNGISSTQHLPPDHDSKFNNQPLNYIPDNAYGQHSVANKKELPYMASPVLSETSHSPKPTSRGGSRRGSSVDQRYFSLPRHGMKERLSYHSSQESFSSQTLNDDRNSPPPPPAPEDHSRSYRHSIALMV